MLLWSTLHFRVYIVPIGPANSYLRSEKYILRKSELKKCASHNVFTFIEVLGRVKSVNNESRTCNARKNP